MGLASDGLSMAPDTPGFSGLSVLLSSLRAFAQFLVSMSLLFSNTVRYAVQRTGRESV